MWFLKLLKLSTQAKTFGYGIASFRHYLVHQYVFSLLARLVVLNRNMGTLEQVTYIKKVMCLNEYRNFDSCNIAGSFIDTFCRVLSE